MSRYHTFFCLLLTGIIALSFAFVINESPWQKYADTNIPNTGYTSAVGGNYIPEALPRSFSVEANIPTTFDLFSYDTDKGDTLTYYIVANPAHGRVDLVSRISNYQQRYTYTPIPGYSGPDFFTFRVADGKDTSRTATVQLLVGKPVAEVPVTVPPLSVTPASILTADNNSHIISGGGPLTIDVTGRSTNPSDTLTYVITRSPRYGRLDLHSRVSNNLQKYTYTPQAGYSGADSFSFKVMTSSVQSGEANVSLTVKPAVSTAVSPVTPVQVPVQLSEPLHADASLRDSSSSYPLSVHRYAYEWSQRNTTDRNLNLQQALDLYGAIRLDNADYTKLGNSPRTLVITGSQKVYGLPDTIIPNVAVVNGSGAVLSRVRTGSLNFSGTTRNSTFKHLQYTDVRSVGASLEGNIFLDLNYTTLHFDNSVSGYTRNNRFIRIRSQSSFPQLTMRGDASGNRPSSGNVFIGFNFLTPNGDPTVIEHQDDLTFVGIDAEAWNNSAFNLGSALFRVGSGGVFSVFGVNGGGGRSPVYDINSSEFRSFGTYIHSNSPKTILRSGVQRALIGNSNLSQFDDYSRAGSKFRILEDLISPDPRYNGVAYSDILPAGSQSELRSLLVSGDRSPVWQAPAYEEPAPGSNVAVDWNRVPDSTAYLQSKINANEIVPAGTYYIRSSLVVDSKHILWGAGPRSTVIIAPSTVDMVVSGAHRNGPDWGQARIAVGDLTLQGGRSGIKLDAQGAGMYAQITDSVITNVTMRDMAVAGIWAESIYAMDNSFFDRVYIVNSNTAFKQSPIMGCQGATETPGTTYLDKNYFYASQFIGNRIGFDLPSCRPNNANFVINSLFKNNTLSAVRMIKNTAPFFINSDFVGNGGSVETPTISNKVAGGSWSNNIFVVGSRFENSLASAVLGAIRIDIEGSTFSRGATQNAKIVAGSVNTSIHNSRSEISAGVTPSGVFLNNVFPSGDVRSNPVVYMNKSTPRVLVGGTSNPYSQLLNGLNR